MHKYARKFLKQAVSCLAMEAITGNELRDRLVGTKEKVNVEDETS